MLIRINVKSHHGMTDTELYEATRKWWVIGADRRQLGSPTAPDWAFSVHGGIVRAVYRIEGWHEADAEAIASHETNPRRWAFSGTTDPDLADRHLHGDVTEYLLGTDSKSPPQNPIRFVNRQ